VFDGGLLYYINVNVTLLAVGGLQGLNGVVVAGRVYSQLLYLTQSIMTEFSPLNLAGSD
jgi:hypothetical protein